MLTLHASPSPVRRFIRLIRLGLPLVCILTSAAEARTIHVAMYGDDQYDGSSWANALPHISSAIAVATDDDVIFVKGGYYTPSGQIIIDKRLTLYGGFSEEEISSDLTRRDWWTNRTEVHDSIGPCFTINSPTTIDGIFIENSGGGGGIAAGIDSSATTTLRNCVIRRNSGVSAGAIWQYDEPLTLINCLVVGNSMLYRSDISIVTGYWPAIILAHESPLTLIHCTFADNEVVDRTEDGDISPSNNLTIINSIIRGRIGTPTGPATVIHSNIEGGFPGVGNIDIDPRFGSEYKLLPDSPCIDTGTASEVLYDIRNLSRPIDIPGVGFDGNVSFDMGAFEFREEDIPPPTKTPTITRTPTRTRTPTLTQTPTVTETRLPVPTPDPRADINGDGMVGAEDLLILQREWGRVTGP